MQAYGTYMQSHGCSPACCHLAATLSSLQLGQTADPLGIHASAHPAAVKPAFTACVGSPDMSRQLALTLHGFAPVRESGPTLLHLTSCRGQAGSEEDVGLAAGGADNSADRNERLSSFLICVVRSCMAVAWWPSARWHSLLPRWLLLLCSACWRCQRRPDSMMPQAAAAWLLFRHSLAGSTLTGAQQERIKEVKARLSKAGCQSS